MKSLMLFLLPLITMCLMSPSHANAADGYGSYRGARGLHIASYPTLILGPTIGIGVALNMGNRTTSKKGGPVGALSDATDIMGVVFVGLAAGFIAFPMHVASSLWGATALRKQGHAVSSAVGYTGLGFLGLGTISIVSAIAAGEDSLKVISIVTAAGSFLVAGILSCAQWVINGSHFKNRPEPASLAPLQLQFSARF